MKNILIVAMLVFLLSCSSRKSKSNNNHYTTLPEIGRVVTDLPKQSNIRLKEIVNNVQTDSCGISGVREEDLNDMVIHIVDNQIFSDKIGERITQILDVRSPKEFEEGHLYDAINMDVKDSTSFFIQILELNKELPVAVYSFNGEQSLNAAKIFQKNGFKIIYCLKGGLKQWIKEGRKLQK